MMEGPVGRRWVPRRALRPTPFLKLDPVGSILQRPAPKTEAQDETHQCYYYVPALRMCSVCLKQL